MKKLLITCVFLSACMTPVYAQAESDPFKLPHPVTGEPGVWIPPWVQKMHLDTEVQLKTCTETITLKDQKLAEKDAEIANRILGTEDIRAALGHTQAQLMAEQARLRAAKSTAESRLLWALVATGGAIIAGTVLTLEAVF